MMTLEAIANIMGLVSGLVLLVAVIYCGVTIIKTLGYPNRIIKKTYRLRVQEVQEAVDEYRKKALVMDPFFDYLLPISQEFIENCVEDEKREVDVGVEQFKEVYKLGVTYYMGIRINWVTG